MGATDNNDDVKKILDLENQNKKLKSKIREAEQNILNSSKMLEFLHGSKNINFNTKPSWLTIKRKKRNLTGIPVLFLSDIHYDEVVNPKQIENLNKYNREIASTRILHTFKTAVKFCTEYMKDPKFEGIVCALGGDLLSGNIHEELAETNEAPILESSMYFTEIMIQGLSLLADNFGKVFVPCVVGNHGRLHRKPRAKNRVQDNYEWMIYHNIARHFQKDERFTFFIPDGSDAQFEIYDKKFLLTHGDQFRGGCYPGDTEFLTSNGWKQIKDYEEGDDVLEVDPNDELLARFVKPTRYIKTEKDQFVRIKNRRVNFTTSLNHKHLIRKYYKRELINKTTHELMVSHDNLINGNECNLIGSFNLDEKEKLIPYSDDYIRLKIAVFADGSFDKSNKKPRCRIQVRIQRKIERIRKLLQKNEIVFNETVGVNNVTNFYFHMDDKEKEFKNYWYRANKDQMSIIIDEVLHWDGSDRERKDRNVRGITFSSTSKKSVDFIQFAFTSCGFATKIYEDIRNDRKSICYNLSVNQTTKEFGIQNDTRSTQSTVFEKYDSEDPNMYCFQVPSGYFAVRQHGRVYVSGNSGIAGIFSPLMLGAARKQKRSTFDIMMIGHFHQYIHTQGLIVNGSVKGYDEYAYQMNFPFENPQQSLFVVHPIYGVTFRMPIICNSYLMKKDKQKIRGIKIWYS